MKGIYKIPKKYLFNTFGNYLFLNLKHYYYFFYYYLLLRYLLLYILYYYSTVNICQNKAVYDGVYVYF